MKKPIAIDCQNLEKTYKVGFWQRKVQALKPLNLQVHAGESFGFIGPNGAGKTTTLKILVGLQFASGGHAEVFGQKAGGQKANACIGFLPERPYFYGHLTGRELLQFYGRLFGLGGASLAKKIDGLLDKVNLRDFEHVPLRAYSKGMLQRAGLAQVLLNDPKLIILDEPMSGLDPMGRMLVRDILLEERAKGTTLFFSSHILADVEQICDRVALLIQGQLKACGPIEELLSSNVERVDCVVSLPTDPPEFATILGTDGDRMRLRLPAEKVNGFLENTLAQGGTVHELLPQRQSLEALLVEQLDHKKEAIDPKKLGVLG